MNKMQSFVRSKKYYLAGSVIVAIVLYLFFASGGNKIESYAVDLANIEQSVILSGDVRTSDRADLGFASSGRIARINVKNNQEVRQGQVLAQLEIGGLLADLRIKQINIATSLVDLSGAKEDLENVRSQENVKVENAYKNLLSSNLELIPEHYDYQASAPFVKGAYSGGDGIYKVSIEKDNPTSDNYILRTFNLEKTIIEINKEGPTQLGTKGLYITFPDNLDLYNNTIWYLSVPNKTSSSYLSNLNAYNEAKESRDRAIKQAETDYQKLITEKSGSQSAIIQAEIDKINAEIRQHTIYAPFSGKVTSLDKKIGENASSGERIISILGEEKLEVVLQVSELDVSKIVPDSSIIITLDALPGEEFVGILRTINSKETKIEGVPVYEAFVELGSDPRIKTGMSAKGMLILDSRRDVVAIPSYFIKKDGPKNTVTVILNDGKTEERIVEVGLIGTDNMVEIKDGLSLGEKILARATVN